MQTMKLLVVCAVLFLSLHVPTHADDSNEESDTDQQMEETTSPPENIDSDSDTSTDPPEEAEPESDVDPTPAPEDSEPEATEAPEDVEPETQADPTPAPEKIEPDSPAKTAENFEAGIPVDPIPAPGNLEPETQVELSITGSSTSGTSIGNKSPVETEATYSANNAPLDNTGVLGADQASQYLEKSISPNVVESMVDSSISAGIPISKDTMYLDMSQQNAANTLSASSSGYEQNSPHSFSASAITSAANAPSQAAVPEAEPMVKIEVSAAEVLSSGIPVGPAEPVVDAVATGQSASGSVRYETQTNPSYEPSINVVAENTVPESFVPTAPVVESAPNTASGAAEVTSDLVVSAPSGDSYSSMADFLTGKKSQGSASESTFSVTKVPVTTPIPSIPEPPKVTLPKKPQQSSAVNTVSRITKKVNRIINFHRQKFTFYKCQTTCLVESIRCMRSCRTNTTFVLYKDDYLKCGKKCRVRQYHCKKLCKTELTRERTDQLRLIRTSRRL